MKIQLIDLEERVRRGHMPMMLGLMYSVLVILL